MSELLFLVRFLNSIRCKRLTPEAHGSLTQIKRFLAILAARALSRARANRCVMLRPFSKEMMNRIHA
jgi:hypothetical protein